jgi:succinate-acetate transporter protein
MSERKEELIGNPTPIGLMGLAFGCAALAPAELGWTLVNDPRIWLWVLVAGGVLQVWAGVVDLVNHNVLGATAFTLYGSLWLISGAQMGFPFQGDPMVKVYVYVFYLAFTAWMTVGFMTVSLNLTIVFLEFVLIFILEIAGGINPSLNHTIHPIVGTLHLMAAIQVVWAAAGGVLNSKLGRNLFKQGEPPLRPAKAKDDESADHAANDFGSLNRHLHLRERIVWALYKIWEEKGDQWTTSTDVCACLGKQAAVLRPDFWYLYRKGYVEMDEAEYAAHPDAPKKVRITATGIDYYGQMQMRKFKF